MCDLENKVNVIKLVSTISTSEQCIYTSLVKIHPLVQKIGSGKTDFYSLYRMVTLKIGSRSPKSNQLFIVLQ